MKHLIAKGTLIPIGGGEDKEENKEILRRIISETGVENPKICMLTIGTNHPEKAEETYKNAFKNLCIDTPSFIYYSSRDEADTKENITKIKDCDLVMMSGGNQLKLSTLLGGTKLLELIKERYCEEAKFVVAGTSAGAAAMSNTMIIKGSGADALIKGTLELTNGLDFINSVFIDTHFTERGRIGRLIQTVAGNPGVLGLGLGEDTSLIIKDEVIEVCGSGLVIIADGTGINYSNLSELKNGEPITVEGIRLHVLGEAKRFSLTERKLLHDKK